ncbi:uncharacterized protein [Dermacentor andersoni]|uniref:uncharacterized protein n=1 Tax=Dermacentor andersoni TaxID=34620 RepID=UPI0021551F82|nr:uncharacterized protein LOC126529120 [Dermacentor andersoni]
MESPATESRPTRQRARRLTEEQLQEMLNSDTDCSDDDPDFFSRDPSPKSQRSHRRQRRSRESSQSSEDVDNPDKSPPRKKAVKAKSEPVKKKVATKEVRKNGPKRSSSWAPAYNVPPPIENPAAYSLWDTETKVVEPVKKADKTYYCCVHGCDSGDTSDKDGLWLFAMPEKQELMSVWVERLPINYERNRPLSPRVCFRHFDKSDFVRRQQRLLGLREDAIPLKKELPDDTLQVKKEAS